MRTPPARGASGCGRSNTHAVCPFECDALITVYQRRRPVRIERTQIRHVTPNTVSVVGPSYSSSKPVRFGFTARTPR